MWKHLLLVLLISGFNIYGQKRNAVWCFGDSAGIDFSNLSNPLPVFSGMDGRGSCASISDTTGNLLFYCFENMTNDHSVIVHNFTNDTVTNGKDLNGQGEYNQITIIPKPNEPNKYYIFHNGIFSTQGFYYSEVDMSLNTGLGEIIQKNVQLLSVRMSDCVQAIKHGNGRDWWVIAKQSGPGNTQFNRFYAYLVSPAGISSPVIQSFGNSTDGDFQKNIFNNKATQFINMNFAGFMCQYDFDRCTGIISNPNIIFPELTSNYNRFFWEGAYSPNDSLFYTTTGWLNFPQDTSRLLQFNLFAANIPASCDTLYEQRNPNIFGAVRLAPDSKIYMTSGYNWGFPQYPYPDTVRNVYNENLSVINYPDSLGAACNFQPFSFYLGGKRTYAGLPNNPNYGLGRFVGSTCDTLNVSVGELEVNNKKELFVFYHSSWQTVFINAKHLKGMKYELHVFDLMGKEVYTEAGKLSSEYFTRDLNCIAFAKGMYIVNLATDKEVISKKFMKQ